jgi:hypothetical protein
MELASGGIARADYAFDAVAPLASTEPATPVE